MPAGMHNCAHCRSAEVIAGVDRIQCMECGKHTFFDGSPAPSGLSLAAPVSAGAVAHAEAILRDTPSEEAETPKKKAGKS